MSQHEQLPPIAYSVKEAIRVSSLGKTRLYQLIASGDLKVKRLGRRTLIMADSLQALLRGEA